MTLFSCISFWEGPSFFSFRLAKFDEKPVRKKIKYLIYPLSCCVHWRDSHYDWTIWRKFKLCVYTVLDSAEILRSDRTNAKLHDYSGFKNANTFPQTFLHVFPKTSQVEISNTCSEICIQDTSYPSQLYNNYGTCLFSMIHVSQLYTVVLYDTLHFFYIKFTCEYL